MKTKHLLPFFQVGALAALLGLVPAGLAQSVLLTASNYALLGGTAITVGGPGPNAIVNGNVGLSTAATSNITGFPPGVVSGVTAGGSPAAIIATGGATGQAGLDLITARNALFAMPHIPANDLSNLDLGTLAALRPGVYFSTSASVQTGTIVLDANFQNGAAWVFNLALSLTTAANSAVTFINLGTNGGADNGLYWNAGSAINIGDSNTISGNYLAGTAISFTGITTTLGQGGTRALAGTGVTFAGPGTINPLGGPGGGDNDGGLMYNNAGQLVPIVPGVPPPVVVLPIVAVVPPGSVVPVIVPAPGAAFSGSILLSSTGAYTRGTSTVVLVPGTSYPATSLTVDGIGGNGATAASLTITTATVALTGLNTYTGGTFVDGGVLVAGSTNLPANQTVALSNNGALVFNQPADGTFGGVISGNGAVSKAGTGALILSGSNAYTGGTFVNGGTLVATSATLPANRNVMLANGSALAFNQTADGAFAGNITGNGTVQKQGSAALTLSGTSSALFAIQAGSLFNNGTLGATTVSTGALLGGNGTINGNLVNNGTVSPGNSPGTIIVAGNYTQSSTGTLLIEIASASSFDHLVVAGTASLAGTLQVSTLGGYNPLGHSFTFLDAAGGVNGTFGTVSTNFTGAATRATVTYAPTSAMIAFAQLPFATFATTPNQVAIANAAQAVPALTTALNAVPLASQFPAALNALSPQDYQVWSDFAFAHATSLSDHLRQSGRMPTGDDDYYFEGGQRRGHSSGNADLAESAYTASSGLVGGNRAINANLAVGAFFGFDKTTAGFGSGGSSQTTVKNKTAGVRAGWTKGSTWAEGMLAYGTDTYDSTRVISFPGSSTLATSFTRGHQWISSATIGQDLRAGSFTFSPFAGAVASRWKANSFTESGAGAFNATLDNQRAHSLRSQLGAEARYTLGILQPHVRAAWLHEFSDKSRSMSGSFGSASFVLATHEAPRDTGLYSAGLDVLIAPHALVYTEFTAQDGGATKVHNEWRAGLSVSF